MPSAPLVGRWAAAVLALAVAAGSVGSALALSDDLRQQVEAAEALGVLTTGLAEDLRRSESPVRARLHLARALLASALGESPSEEPSGAVAARPARLEEAERLARSVLSAHPASWEAAAIAGAALYLRWSEARDPRLLQEYRRWERPLLLAVDLSPDHRHPGRYLAAAYLELWPVLSEEKRDLARDLVASAFTDPRVFSQLLDPWLRVADPEVALEPIPDRSWAWAALRSRAGRTESWRAYCEAWRRERGALLRDLQARLEEADGLASGGELAGARGALLGIVSAAPPDHAFAPLVDRALRLLPHGPRQPKPSEAAADWLAWAMARELNSETRPLSADSLVRLRALAFPGGSTEPAAAALSAWVEHARGRPRRAEEIEARSASLWQPEWAGYHLLAARAHLGQRRPDQALQALQRVHPDWRRHPLFVEISQRLGQGRREPARGFRNLGGALDWSYSGTAARLAFRAPGAAAGIGLTLAEVPARGAAVEIRWDGASLDCRPLDPGSHRLELPLEATAGVHELELVPLAGDRIYPGSVELLPPPPPARPG